MDAKVYIWLRQSVSRSMDLILLLDAPQHRQLDFIFRLLPSVGRPFWMKPEENLFFQYSVDDEDVQQFVKDLNSGEFNYLLFNNNIYF
jgi:hypothetical protein